MLRFIIPNLQVKGGLEKRLNSNYDLSYEFLLISFFVDKWAGGLVSGNDQLPFQGLLQICENRCFCKIIFLWK